MEYKFFQLLTDSQCLWLDCQAYAFPASVVESRFGNEVIIMFGGAGIVC